MAAPKAHDKAKTEDMNLGLVKMLQDENSELLFAVTIYKNQVVGSVNARLTLSEKTINEIVQLICKAADVKNG